MQYQNESVITNSNSKPMCLDSNIRNTYHHKTVTNNAFNVRTSLNINTSVCYAFTLFLFVLQIKLWLSNSWKYCFNCYCTVQYFILCLFVHAFTIPIRFWLAHSSVHLLKSISIVILFVLILSQNLKQIPTIISSWLQVFVVWAAIKRGSHILKTS